VSYIEAQELYALAYAYTRLEITLLVFGEQALNNGMTFEGKHDAQHGSQNLNEKNLGWDWSLRLTN
jgi:hypothetical protein